MCARVSVCAHIHPSQPNGESEHFSNDKWVNKIIRAEKKRDGDGPLQGGDKEIRKKDGCGNEEGGKEGMSDCKVEV